jgi:cupin 2 domain-containing protein
MSTNSAANLFDEVPCALGEEQFKSLLISRNVRIERIVSMGQSSPPGFWYDQEEGEWVVVLKGAAKLLVEGEDTPLRLGPGDFIDLPAHTRHRVEWTDPTTPTVWLAVFYR